MALLFWHSSDCLRNAGKRSPHRSLCQFGWETRDVHSIGHPVTAATTDNNRYCGSDAKKKNLLNCRSIVGSHEQKNLHTADFNFFLLSLLIPWATLLVMVENVAHLERLLWLWPLQVIILAALVTYVAGRLQASRIVQWIGSLLLTLVLVLNPLLISRVKDWYNDGWSGSDADQVRVVQYVADRLGPGETGRHLSI